MITWIFLSQIIDTLCLFRSCNTMTKLKSLYSFYGSFYGCKLCDLNNSNVSIVLLAPLCDHISVLNELCKRNCSFNNMHH